LVWFFSVLALVIVTLVAGVLWMTAVPGRSHSGPLPALTLSKSNSPASYGTTSRQSQAGRITSATLGNWKGRRLTSNVP
jgi:hypothetical protein